MPVQKTTSSVLAKVQNKLKAAMAAHANDETDYGFQRIPPGILNGVAQLTSVTFDVYKTGKNQNQPYCRMAGVVVEPKEIVVNGVVVPVVGLQTSQMFPLCDTVTSKNESVSFDQNAAKLLNAFRKVGVETAGATDIESLGRVAEEAGPYFRFATKPKKDQQTGQETGEAWEEWYGSKGLEDYTPPDADAVEDETEEAPARPTAKPSANGVVGHNKAKNDRFAKQYGATEKTLGKTAALALEEFDEFGDLDGLATRADDGDADAAGELETMAKAAGVPAEAVKDTANWGEVAELIRGAGAPAADEEEAVEEETADEPEEFVPVVGNVYMYRPVVKGKAGKPVEVEVTEIQFKTQTVTAKNLDDAKVVYPKVPWAALSDNG